MRELDVHLGLGCQDCFIFFVLVTFFFLFFSLVTKKKSGEQFQEKIARYSDHPRPGLSLAPFACPVAAPPTTADARGVKTETMSLPPERSPRGAHTARCPGAATPALPSPRHNDGLRGKPDPCRKHPAPPPSRCSKDVTAHPHRPGGRPDRPYPATVRSGRHRSAKAGSGPHSGTEVRCVQI